MPFRLAPTRKNSKTACKQQCFKVTWEIFSKLCENKFCRKTIPTAPDQLVVDCISEVAGTFDYKKLTCELQNSGFLSRLCIYICAIREQLNSFIVINLRTVMQSIDWLLLWRSRLLTKSMQTIKNCCNLSKFCYLEVLFVAMCIFDYLRCSSNYVGFCNEKCLVLIAYCPCEGLSWPRRSADWLHTSISRRTFGHLPLFARKRLCCSHKTSAEWFRK